MCQDEYSTTSLSIGGCPYASAGFVQGGIGGGEAMDDCGLRFLLALHNHHMLSKSLPKDVVLEGLLPSNFVWAFHSDAESEFCQTFHVFRRTSSTGLISRVLVLGGG